MYSKQDIQNAGQKVKGELTISLILLALGVAFIVAGMIIRNKNLAIIGGIAGSWLFYTHLMIKTMPWVRYKRFLNDLTNGLSHETDAWFCSMDESPRMLDGLAVYDVTVRVGDAEEDSRLFYWDADKPRPELKPDERVHIVSFGKYITQLDKM